MDTGSELQPRVVDRLKVCIFCGELIIELKRLGLCRRQDLRAVWAQLRAAIDKGYERPLLHTVRGAGYVLRDGG